MDSGLYPRVLRGLIAVAATIDLLTGDEDRAIGKVAAMRSEGTRPRIGPATWTRQELLIWWDNRSYRDPLGDVSCDWDDDVERLAIALLYLSWNTPEQIASLLASPSARAAMSGLWAALRPTDRQYLRCRAVLLLILRDEPIQ
jgi:hypothetical protein